MKALPSESDVLAHLAENGGKIRKAAKHFGCTQKEIRSLAGKPPSRTRARDSPAKRRSKLSPLEWRMDKLVSFEELWERAAEEAKPNIVGMAAISKSMMTLRNEIDKLQADAPDGLENATPEEIREALGMAMEEWPNEHLELAFRVYSDRHGGRVLFLHEGGSQTEYSADEGWRVVES